MVIEVPRDGRARFIIDSLASYVSADGCAFEQAVMTSSAGDPELAFLFNLRSLEHAYYRWPPVPSRQALCGTRSVLRAEGYTTCYSYVRKPCTSD